MNKNINKNKIINKDKLIRISWSAGQAIMLVTTFILGSWFVVIATMYSFLMGIQFCRNNWIKGMPKVEVTNKIIKKEDLK